MYAAHHRAQQADREDDLVVEGERDARQDLARDQGSGDESHRQHRVADAGDVATPFRWHRLGKERVETNRQRRAGDRHQQRHQHERPELALGQEQPRDDHPDQVEKTVEDRRPEDRWADGPAFQPAAGRQREDQVDHRRAGGQHTDHERAGAQARRVDGQKRNCAAAEHAIPGDVPVQVAKNRAIFSRYGLRPAQECIGRHGQKEAAAWRSSSGRPLKLQVAGGKLKTDP